MGTEMSDLLRKISIKSSWLVVCLISALVCANGAYAEGWTINSSATKKTPSLENSSVESDAIYANIDPYDKSTTQPADRPYKRSADRGVLLVQDDTSSGYRSSSYKIDDVNSVPAFSPESDYSRPETGSNNLENLEAGRPLGKGVIYPIANVSLGYRDNVYELDESGAVEQTGATTLQWRFGGGYQGSDRGHLNGVEYSMEGYEFLSGDSDHGEVAQRLNGYWGTAFTPRHHVDLGVEYLDAYDPRGKGDSIRNVRFNTVEQEADQWHELTGGGIYSFGGERARGRLELSGYLTNREYDNNRQQYRNRDELDLGAAVYFRIMAKTEFYGQVVRTELDYVNQGQEDPTGGRDLDSEEMRYLVGLKWYPSENLSGTLRVGSAEKTFEESSGRQDYDELTWDSNLRWSPNARNDFGLAYSRSPREAYVYSAEQLIDDYIETENLDFSWSHLWGQHLRTTFTYTLGQDNYLPSGRKDDRDEFTAGLSYALPRWGAIGLSYFNRQRDSSVADQSYDDDGFAIYFNLGAALGLGDGNARAPGVRNQRRYKPGYAVY
jgi:hypothetical protein